VASHRNPLDEKTAGHSRSVEHLTSALTPHSFSFNLDECDTLTTFIAENYISEDELQNLSFGKSAVRGPSQICGAWVEVLPLLCARREQNDALPLAMKALALSILDKDSRKALSQSEYVDAYCSALKALRTGITRSHPHTYADFAAASMCLTLSEVSNRSCHFPNRVLAVAYHLIGKASDLRAWLGCPCEGGRRTDATPWPRRTC
jgi:hypothetical protein